MIEKLEESKKIYLKNVSLDFLIRFFIIFIILIPIHLFVISISFNIFIFSLSLMFIILLLLETTYKKSKLNKFLKKIVTSYEGFEESHILTENISKMFKEFVEEGDQLLSSDSQLKT